MDAKTKFEVFSFLGAGDIRFGMSPSEVENLIGAPEQESRNHLKQRIEFRSFMNVAYTPAPDQSFCLTHIGFGRQMESVFFGETNFFLDTPSDVLRKLVLLDSRPLLYLGFVVFRNLGIALTGFHDNDLSQKAVSLFEKGVWDKRAAKMTPFHLG